MTARLLANMGIIKNHLGNYDEGIELIQKSINICRNYDLFEQLERSYSVLAELYLRKKEYSKAILHYDLAIEVAGKIELYQILYFYKFEHFRAFRKQNSINVCFALC